MPVAFPTPQNKEDFEIAARRLSEDIDALWGPLGGILNYTPNLPGAIQEELRDLSQVLADLDKRGSRVADIAKWALTP